MKKDNFYKNSFLLTLSNLTTGILGFMFSIILSRELGPEGMGLYGLIMPIYNLFICLICAGVITAISKLSAVYFDNKDFGNMKKTIKTTMIFNLIWAIIIASLVFILASYIGSYLIKDTRTINAIKITCPAMVFISLSNILKGYFYGTSKITIPAFIDIFEKAIRICVIILVVKFLNLNDVSSTVTAAYFALCLGEFISLSLLYIYYKRDINKFTFPNYPLEGRAQLLFNVLVISVPLCINGFVSTALGTVSTLIVPRRLVIAGFEYSSALSMIGKFNGMTLNIVFFPMIVIGSISTVLIPDLSQSINRKDTYLIEERIREVLKIALLLGVSTFIICNSIPSALGYMFFKRNDLTEYIRFASICAPFLYCSSCSYGILNGIGKHNIVLRNSIITSLIELASLYIFTSIRTINIYGYGLTIIISSLLNIILNFHEINKTFKIKISLINILIYGLVNIIFYFIIGYLDMLLPNSLYVPKNILLIILGFSSFFVSILITSYTNN